MFLKRLNRKNNFITLDRQCLFKLIIWALHTYQ